MKKIITTLSITLFIFTGTVILAQPQGKQVYNVFRGYYEDNIKPELLRQQDKFMNVLTDEEKSELLKIKTDWKTVHENMKGTVAPADRKNTRKTHFAAFNSRVEKIVDAHPEMKEQYIKEMTPKKEQWQKDMNAIREENDMPENSKKTYLDRVDDPTFILMWDPDKMYAKKPMVLGMNQQKMKTGEPIKPGITIFPQPAKTTITIKITGVKDKKVTAAVYDASGEKIKELFDAGSSLPVLSFSLDVSGWENGIYTVKTLFGNRNMTMDFEVVK